MNGKCIFLVLYLTFKIETASHEEWWLDVQNGYKMFDGTFLRFHNFCFAKLKYVQTFSHCFSLPPQL
jgi:hypothetical protein